MQKITILTWTLLTMFGLTPLASAEVLNMPQPTGSAAPVAAQTDAQPTAEVPPAPVPAPTPDAAAPTPAAAAPTPDEAAPTPDMAAPTPDAAAPMPSEPPASSHATVSQSSSMTVPGRGMHMPQVEARFGAPQEKMPAVGKPPITRWVYPNYTVYFEYDIVIDSVLHQR